MPATLTRQIYRGWQRHESYWDTPGMNENLKVISDHLPSLNVVGVNVSTLPATATEGETVLNLATGGYSIYSLSADGLSSAWQTYPASKGMLALFDGAVYGSTGTAWEVVASNINIQQGENITITGDGTQASPYVISARSQIVTSLGAFTMDNSTAPSGGYGRKFYADTVPNGYNIGAGRMSFSADLAFDNYFSVNPIGHLAIVLRQDPALAETSVRGNGIAIGNLTGATEGTQVNPGAQIELWANTVNPQQNRLVPGADSKEALVDGVYYKLLIESSVAPDGNKYARMAIYKQTARGYDCVVDTGDVLDTLAGSDFTKSGLLIGHVFGSNASGWSIQFTNMKVWWGPFSAKNTDTSYIESGGGGGGSDSQTLSISGNNLSISGGNSVTLPTGTVPDGSETKVTAGTNVTVTGTGTTLSPYVINATGGTGSATDRVLRAGDTMTGTLNFSGNNLRLGIPYYAGASYANSMLLQNTQANTETSIVAVPNGTAASANFTAANNSNIAASTAFVSFGMEGTNAVINSFGLNGSGSPGLNIQNGGVTVATFNQNGLAMSGAAKYIGEATTLLSGPSNLGGFNANVLGVAALDLEVMSTSGTIKNYLQSQGLTASQADGVETITRPLYAFMSCLLAELKYRKVI
jgi:hypothetical protein